MAASRLSPRPEFASWRANIHGLEGVAARGSDDYSMTGTGAPERVHAAVVTTNFFSVLGVVPLSDGISSRQKAGQVRRELCCSPMYVETQLSAASPSAVGSVVSLNDRAYTVTGILPRQFRFPGDDEVDLVVPFQEAGFAWSDQRLMILQVFGRVRPGVTLRQAATELQAITERDRANIPPFFQHALMRNPLMIVPLREWLTGKQRPALAALLGAVGLLLLIACVNVANLQLARATEQAARNRASRRVRRQPRPPGSLADRRKSGAERDGGRVGNRDRLRDRGAVAACAGIPASRLRRPATGLDSLGRIVRSLRSYGTGGRTRARAGRSSAGAERNPEARRAFGRRRTPRPPALRVSNDPSRARARVAGRRRLVAAELGPRSLRRSRISGGESAHLADALASFTLSYRCQAGPVCRCAARKRANAAGVESAAVTSSLPLTASTNLGSVLFEGQPAPPPGQRPTIPLNVVTPDYFHAMGISLVAGRVFDRSDAAGSPPVVIVNQAFAKRFYPGEPCHGQAHPAIWTPNTPPSPAWLPTFGIRAGKLPADPQLL